MCGNWNVRHATSQQVLKATTFCTNTCFQSFFAIDQLHRPPCSAEISPCRNKTLPQLVHIVDWYSIYTLLQHAPDVVIYRPHVRTDELWCLTAQKLDCVTSTMCWLVESCWKTNTSAAMLQIAVASSASATRLCNTAR